MVGFEVCYSLCKDFIEFVWEPVSVTLLTISLCGTDKTKSVYYDLPFNCIVAFLQSRVNLFQLVRFAAYTMARPEVKKLGKATWT